MLFFIFLSIKEEVFLSTESQCITKAIRHKIYRVILNVRINFRLPVLRLNEKFERSSLEKVLKETQDIAAATINLNEIMHNLKIQINIAEYDFNLIFKLYFT